MDFQNTVMAHRFFESQVPDLIKELKEINQTLAAKTEKAKDAALSDEQKRRWEDILRDQDKAEKLGQALLEQIQTDDEAPHKIGFYFAKAILDNSVEDLMIAICGWSPESLLNIAETGTPHPDKESSR